MGLFRVPARLTGPTGRSEQVELLVDSGATLLGAVALESLFLAIDPVAKRLVPVEGFVGHLILRSSACHCEA